MKLLLVGIPHTIGEVTTWQTRNGTERKSFRFLVRDPENVQSFEPMIEAPAEVLEDIRALVEHGKTAYLRVEVRAVPGQGDKSPWVKFRYMGSEG